MSIAVNTYPATPYRQTPIAWPVKLFDPPKQRPASVMLKFDWSVYFAAMNSAPEIAVDVDINSGGTSQGPVLDKIVTAKIDNSNSYVPILLFFPDSGDIVSCPPQTIVTLPCTTNGSNCKVIAQGLSAGNTPQTNIIFYNYFIPPSVDPALQLVYPQWKGSPTIQRNEDQILTPGYGSPALGDQAIQYMVDFQLNPYDTPIFGTPLPSGFIYITGITISLIDPFAGATTSPYLEMKSNVSGTLYQFYYTLLPSTRMATGAMFAYNKSGLNIKLDATESWVLRNSQFLSSFGINRVAAYFEYTINPE